MKGIFQTIGRFFWTLFISLKLAVVILMGLTASLITATLLESAYDTPTAQYWVYQTNWFHFLLALLGVNILCVALSRLPWKPKHIPFLLAHLGILMLLYGSWITEHFGIDGSMQIGEGSTTSAVELSQPMLLVSDDAAIDQNNLGASEKGAIQAYSVPWIPPNAEFKPIHFDSYGLTITDFISHADSKVSFVAADARDQAAVPAIHIRLQGGKDAPPFMRSGQDYWLWLGDMSFMEMQAGGAMLGARADRFPEFQRPGAALGFRLPLEGKGLAKKEIGFLVRTDDQKNHEGKFAYRDPSDLKGRVIDTGWRFGIRITILDYIPRAVSHVDYSPAMIQYGNQAPSSAIRLQAPGGGPGSELWLGLGDRATLSLPNGKSVGLTYYPRRIVLPFGIELDRFKIDRYQGTDRPREFSSLINVADTVKDAPHGRVISMNEPLKYGGFTFYQSSYIEAEPRPTVSIFSVNQDPGRWLKYVGSLLIVFGALLLVASKYKKRKPNL